jgi:hypothetical protein
LKAEMKKLILSDNIQIEKDIDSTWRLLTDISNWSRWAKVIDHAAIYGSYQVGTQFKCVSDKWDFDSTISSWSPHSGFACKGKSIGLNLLISWTLSSDDKATKVTWSISASGPLISIFRRRFKEAISDSMFTWMYSLKTHLERGDKKNEPQKIPGLSSQKALKKMSFSNPFGLAFDRKRKDDDTN